MIRLLSHHFALRDIVAATWHNLGQENIYRLTSLPGINPGERRRRAAEGMREEAA